MDLEDRAVPGDKAVPNDRMRTLMQEAPTSVRDGCNKMALLMARRRGVTEEFFE